MSEKKIPTNFIPNKFPVCPQCGSKNVTARLATKTFWCRRCMHIGDREEFFKVQDLYNESDYMKKASQFCTGSENLIED